MPDLATATPSYEGDPIAKRGHLPPGRPEVIADRPLTGEQEAILADLWHRGPRWGVPRICDEFEARTGRMLSPASALGRRPNRGVAKLPPPPPVEADPVALAAVLHRPKLLTIVQADNVHRLWREHPDASPEFIAERFRCRMGREIAPATAAAYKPEEP